MADPPSVDERNDEETGDLSSELVGRGPELLDRLRTAALSGKRLWAWIAALAVLVLVFGVGDVSLANTLVIGIQTGAVYALFALGIALVYKATRVLNFAQGQLGTVPAFLAYAIMVGFDWSDAGPAPVAGRLWWATIIAILFGAGLAVLINVLVVQRLAEASPVTSLVATIGVALFFSAGEVIIFQARLRPFPRYITGDAFAVGNVGVDWHTVLIVAVLAVAAGLLALFFQTTPGTALLATAQEPFAAQLSGVSVRTMSALAWAAAGAFGAVGGLLGAGVFENIRPGLVTTTFLIPAFTGAVLGGLTSMVGAVVGGVSVGVIVAFANELNLAYDLGIPGPPQVAILLVLLLVLVLRPRGLFGEEA